MRVDCEAATDEALGLLMDLVGHCVVDNGE